jgi:hypothetical protein
MQFNKTGSHIGLNDLLWLLLGLHESEILCKVNGLIRRARMEVVSIIQFEGSNMVLFKENIIL